MASFGLIELIVVVGLVAFLLHAFHIREHRALLLVLAVLAVALLPPLSGSIGRSPRLLWVIGGIALIGAAIKSRSVRKGLLGFGVLMLLIVIGLRLSYRTVWHPNSALPPPVAAAVPLEPTRPNYVATNLPHDSFEELDNPSRRVVSGDARQATYLDVKLRSEKCEDLGVTAAQVAKAIFEIARRTAAANDIEDIQLPSLGEIAVTEDHSQPVPLSKVARIARTFRHQFDTAKRLQIGLRTDDIEEGPDVQEVALEIERLIMAIDSRLIDSINMAPFAPIQANTPTVVVDTEGWHRQMRARKKEAAALIAALVKGPPAAVPATQPAPSESAPPEAQAASTSREGEPAKGEKLNRKVLAPSEQTPPTVPHAAVEKKPSKRADSAGLPKVVSDRPAWVDKPPATERSTYFLTDHDGPFSTTNECYARFPDLLTGLTRQYADALYAGSVPAEELDIRYAELRSAGIFRECYFESVTSPTLGQMYEAHVLAGFDDHARAYLDWLRRRPVVHRRLAVVGSIAGLLLGGIATLFGFLKIDTATRGYYSVRLAGSAVALFLLIVGVAMMLLEWAGVV